MPPVLTHSIDGNLLKINISGPFESDRFQPILEQVWGWCQTPGVQKLLVDVRELDGRVSLGQTFFNIRQYPSGGTRFRTAILELPRYMENAKFHDTAASNMGFSVRHFTDEAEAMAWLG